MLIGIYLAEAEGRSIGIEQVADYAAIPTSTARRWIKLLQERDIIEIAPARVDDLQLTREGLDGTEAMLATVYEAPNAAVMLD